MPARVVWEGGHHDFGETASFFLCQTRAIGGQVSVSSRADVTFSPTEANFDPDTAAVIEFEVTVASEYDGVIDLELTLGGASGGVPGIRISSDSSGWVFEGAETKD